MTMDEMMPTRFPYTVDNVNFGERYVSINYSDPTKSNGEIAHFDQVVFPADVAEDDIAEVMDQLCLLIDKVQVLRRGPSPRIVPRAVPGG
jgi:hypothetical protein